MASKALTIIAWQICAPNPPAETRAESPGRNTSRIPGRNPCRNGFAVLVQKLICFCAAVVVTALTNKGKITTRKLNAFLNEVLKTYVF